jgi:inorganic pyrophosphatase
MASHVAPSLSVAHPWHGISSGDEAPRIVHAFIEIVPSDEMKYEVDKRSGHIMIDRPQKYSSQVPAAYGFIPQTYCGTEVGKLAGSALKRPQLVGDGDPIDICVLSERPIGHHGVFVRAVPIGGFRMIDDSEADDKIIAILEGDAVYGNYKDIHDCPKPLIERLEHYFLSYKSIPGRSDKKVEIGGTYNAQEAQAVITASMVDYRSDFRTTFDAYTALLHGAKAEKAA